MCFPLYSRVPQNSLRLLFLFSRYRYTFLCKMIYFSVNITVILILSANSDPIEKFLPSILEDVQMSPHNLPFPPTAQTVKMLVLQFRVSCATNLDCSIQMVVKWVYQNPTQRMVEKSDFVCGSVLSKYEGTGSEKDQKLLNSIYIRENISCSGKIELPYYSIDNFPKICIYYEVKGTSHSLGTSLETYFKCEPWRFKREREKQWYKVTYRRRKRNEDILYIYQCYKLIL